MICTARNSPPFNILYLHETSKISGAENSLLNLVRGLDKSTFKPFFVLPEEGPLAAELRGIGIDVNIVGMPQVRRLIGVVSAAKRLRRLVEDKRIGLIHSNSIRTHFYAWMAGRGKGIPVVWHQRNLITKEVVDPDRLFSFLPDKIVCNSEAIASRFLSKDRLPPKVEVVHNGVDTRMFSPSADGKAVRQEFGIKDDEIVVGIASRFHRLKGHETFFEAAKILLRDMPQRKLKFLVAGGAVFDADMRRELEVKIMANDGQLKGRVIFTGFRGEMPQVYAAMDIFVLASGSEACGRVAIEAMASGKPVVGTNTGGTPELVEDGMTGLLFPPGDANALANALKTLIDDGAKRQAMGVAGRKRAEEMFSIEANVGKIQHIYRQLLEG